MLSSCSQMVGLLYVYLLSINSPINALAGEIEREGEREGREVGGEREVNQIKGDCDCIAYPQGSGVLMRKLRRRMLLWMCFGWMFYRREC